VYMPAMVTRRVALPAGRVSHEGARRCHQTAATALGLRTREPLRWTLMETIPSVSCQLSGHKQCLGLFVVERWLEVLQQLL
jgi:hypothetical protein